MRGKRGNPRQGRRAGWRNRVFSCVTPLPLLVCGPLPQIQVIHLHFKLNSNAHKSLSRTFSDISLSNIYFVPAMRNRFFVTGTKDLRKGTGTRKSHLCLGLSGGSAGLVDCGLCSPLPNSVSWQCACTMVSPRWMANATVRLVLVSSVCAQSCSGVGEAKQNDYPLVVELYVWFQLPVTVKISVYCSLVLETDTSNRACIAFSSFPCDLTSVIGFGHMDSCVYACTVLVPSDSVCNLHSFCVWCGGMARQLGVGWVTCTRSFLPACHWHCAKSKTTKYLG